MSYLLGLETSGNRMQIEVFFDYACPYCLRAHVHLMELLPSYPDVEVMWRPCESHPRPDRYGPHSDLCIQGMFYALAHGADICAYHDAVYNAALRERVDIEDIDTLADCVRDVVDTDDFRASLRNGEYASVQREANRYAFGESGVWVVPAYRMNGKRLDAVEDVGISKEMLKRFFESAIS